MASPIKFALVGCGHIAPRWLEVFADNPDAQLVAVADPDPQSFKRLTDFSLSAVHTYPRLDDVFAEENIDAVVIATPPQYHSRYIIESIDHGKHVLTEKPLCVNEDQLKHIMAAQKRAEAHGLITAVNQQYRWNPRIQAIHDAVQNNLLGEVFLVHTLFNQNLYHFKRWWRQQHQYISLFNWYVHQIDTMRYYLDQDPVEVWAKFIHPSHSRITGYSSMLLNVTFDGGTEWHMTANQESVAGPTTSGHGKFIMYGTQGTLVNTKNDPPFLFTPDGHKHELGENIADIDNATTYPPGWPDSVAKFIHSIRTGEPHPTSIHDNFWTIGILLAAIRSFEQHKVIRIRDILSK